jgi:hypothetical protein
MNITAIIFSALISGGVFLVLGVFLGVQLGKTGSFEFFVFFMNIPSIAAKGIGRIRTKFHIWKELREINKINKFDKKIKLDKIRKEMQGNREVINSLRKKERKIKWGA